LASDADHSVVEDLSEILNGKLSENPSESVSQHLNMRQLLILVAVCLTFSLLTAADSNDERVFEREMNQLNKAELEAAKRWEDILARKRELARDNRGSQVDANWEVALEERNLEEYLERKERQTTSCIQGDVIFVLDSSGSIGIDNWHYVLQFVSEACNRMNVGPYTTHVGVETYGNRAHIIFNLNNFTSAADMAPVILGAKFLDENTNTSGALWMAKKVMLTAANGERPAAPNMIIVITDGESTYDHDKTIPYADEYKATGDVLISIGVGNQTSQAELAGMASNGGDGKPLVFQVGGYSMLKQIQDSLAAVACDPTATAAPPTHAPLPTQACANDIPPPTQPPVICAAVTCTSKCPYGFVSDANFCLSATCACLGKPQVCPTVAPANNVPVTNAPANNVPG